MVNDRALKEAGAVHGKCQLQVRRYGVTIIGDDRPALARSLFNVQRREIGFVLFDAEIPKFQTVFLRPNKFKYLYLFE